LPTHKKLKTLTHEPIENKESKMTMTRKLNIDNGLQDRKTEHQAVTGGCCQWWDSASYDSNVHIETFVLRGKFSDKIATEQQPQILYNALIISINSFVFSEAPPTRPPSTSG